MPAALLREVVAQLDEHGRDGPEHLQERVLGTMACHTAVRPIAARSCVK
jgi:hypothetical protein